MNNEQAVKTVRTVIGRVLEDASFVFTDELDESVRPDAASWDAAGVALTFSGDRSGVFRIWTDPPFASLLAANMLGIDTGGPAAKDKGTDALKEMVNIITGNALTEIFGDKAVFSLGIPVLADEKLKAADCGRDDAIWLSAEDYKILCVMDSA
jgi:CheY-specific phosphatase CheX